MNRSVRLVSLLLPLVFLLMSCLPDRVGPDDVSYPITYRPTDIENVATVKVFTRSGSAWVEIPHDDTGFDDVVPFVLAPDIDQMRDLALFTDSTWQYIDGVSPVSLYEWDGTYFTFTLLATAIFARGDYERFALHEFFLLTSRPDLPPAPAIVGSVDPDADPFSKILEFIEEDVDTFAYQRYEVVYEAE